ncbi:MAG: pyridoxamine 5'-phosphate oxidase family protein [Actinomycetia bacterium]|nr:pyridoxamine 5'-phosphate oxidase family protein [Actinomycetes bacterium]
MAGAMEWGDVAERLAAARYWWVATAGPRGPHAVPVWGVVADGVPWCYGDPDAVRVRNLTHDSRIVVHLESAEDVLVVHGTAQVAAEPADRPDVVAAYHAKYTAPEELMWLPDAPGMAGAILVRVTPTTALAWTLPDLFGSQRRWGSGPAVPR